MTARTIFIESATTEDRQQLPIWPLANSTNEA